jgi:hypothetical protein
MKDKKWSNLFLEMLMVMAGVFLALMADEWREDRQTANTVSIIEEKIIEEVHKNYNSLLSNEKRLNERYSKLIKWGEGLDYTKSFSEQKGFPGYPTISLANAAWQRANSSQTTNLVDADIVSYAHALYAHNDSVKSSYNPLLELIYNKDSWDSEFTLISLNITKSIFNESISQVEQALNSYRHFVELYPLKKELDD